MRCYSGFGRRGDAPRLLVRKRPVAAKLSEVCTIALHSSYTAKTGHVMCNDNNVMKNFYHPLRRTLRMVNDQSSGDRNQRSWGIEESARRPSQEEPRAHSMKLVCKVLTSFPADERRRGGPHLLSLDVYVESRNEKQVVAAPQPQLSSSSIARGNRMLFSRCTCWWRSRSNS